MLLRLFPNRILRSISFVQILSVQELSARKLAIYSTFLVRSWKWLLLQLSTDSHWNQLRKFMHKVSYFWSSWGSTSQAKDCLKIFIQTFVNSVKFECFSRLILFTDNFTILFTDNFTVIRFFNLIVHYPWTKYHISDKAVIQHVNWK